MITMKDSPNGKRYGLRRRAPGGSPRRTASISRRSPRGMRNSSCLAEEAAVERAEGPGLRRRATIARRANTQILETAQEYGFAGEEWHHTRSRNISSRARAEGRGAPEEMDQRRSRAWQRRQRAARERLAPADPVSPTSRIGAIFCFRPVEHQRVGLKIRHRESEAEQSDDGADEPFGLAQCQTEDRAHR